MKKFNIGLQLYGVRETMKNDFEGTIRAVKEMGYDYVEFAGYYDRTAEEIKALLDELGLKCVSVHQRIDFYDNDPDAAAEFLKAFGVKYSVIPWYAQDKLAGSAEWDETVRKFIRVGEVLKSHGMKLGYHNHEFEFENYDGKSLHDHIFDTIPADLIDPELDTCWVRYAGLDPVEKIRQFKGRVEIVHLKDFVCKAFGNGPAYDLIDSTGKAMKATREDNGFEFRPVGQGLQDMEAILRACEECGTETLIVEQDKTYGGMTELEAARLSREYLKNTFGI